MKITKYILTIINKIQNTANLISFSNLKQFLLEIKSFHFPPCYSALQFLTLPLPFLCLELISSLFFFDDVEDTYECVFSNTEKWHAESTFVVCVFHCWPLCIQQPIVGFSPWWGWFSSLLLLVACMYQLGLGPQEISPSNLKCSLILPSFHFCLCSHF